MPFDRDLILKLYESAGGSYPFQITLHSLISVIIINRIIKIWQINSPSLLQILHLIPVIVPPLSLPLYYLINPSRGSPEFKLMALIDIERLLAIEFMGLSIGLLLLLLMLFSTIIFIGQETIPVIKNIVELKKGEQKRIVRTFEIEFYGHSHTVNVIEDNEYVIFASTGKRPAIFISTGLFEDLSHEELDAAIAHEAAHLIRGKRPFLVIVYIFRILGFFNPVTLIEFRKSVQEEEKICDRMAIRETNNAGALLQVLNRFITDNRGLIDYSHSNLIKERMAILNNAVEERDKTFLIAVGISVTVVLNYFIV